LSFASIAYTQLALGPEAELPPPEELRRGADFPREALQPRADFPREALRVEDDEGYGQQAQAG
jgi:hypothetical protein